MKHTKQWLLAGIVAAMAFVFTGCGGGAPSPAVTKAIESNTPMYTQVGMWYENSRGTNQVIGTNYNVGVHVPVNTKVVVTGTARNGIVVNVNGTPVTIYNISKYTGLDNGAFFDRMLGKQPVSLEKFSKAERNAIAKGAIVKGMSKDAVILSRGYPPSHATPSLDAERWRYWKNRWATMYVVFKDGKVSGTVE